MSLSLKFDLTDESAENGEEEDDDDWYEGIITLNEAGIIEEFVSILKIIWWFP
jgi:hypothetical protein